MRQSDIIDESTFGALAGIGNAGAIKPERRGAQSKENERTSGALVSTPDPDCSCLPNHLRQARSDQAGLAPRVPHFANLPFESRQRVDFAGACLVHFVNLPFASRHGAAIEGAEPAIKPSADRPMINFRIIVVSSFS